MTKQTFTYECTEGTTRSARLPNTYLLPFEIINKGHSVLNVCDQHGVIIDQLEGPLASRTYWSDTIIVPQRISRWHRILVWFGLAREPRPHYHHTWRPVPTVPTD